MCKSTCSVFSPRVYISRPCGMSTQLEGVYYRKQSHIDVTRGTLKIIITHNTMSTLRPGNKQLIYTVICVINFNKFI